MRYDSSEIGRTITSYVGTHNWRGREAIRDAIYIRVLEATGNECEAAFAALDAAASPWGRYARRLLPVALFMFAASAYAQDKPVAVCQRHDGSSYYNYSQTGGECDAGDKKIKTLTRDEAASEMQSGINVLEEACHHWLAAPIAVNPTTGARLMFDGTSWVKDRHMRTYVDCISDSATNKDFIQNLYYRGLHDRDLQDAYLSGVRALAERVDDGKITVTEFASEKAALYSRLSTERQQRKQSLPPLSHMPMDCTKTLTGFSCY